MDSRQTEHVLSYSVCVIDARFTNLGEDNNESYFKHFVICLLPFSSYLWTCIRCGGLVPCILYVSANLPRRWRPFYPFPPLDRLRWQQNIVLTRGWRNLLMSGIETRSSSCSPSLWALLCNVGSEEQFNIQILCPDNTSLSEDTL